jgi:hypothetical protein
MELVGAAQTLRLFMHHLLCQFVLKRNTFGSVPDVFFCPTVQAKSVLAPELGVGWLLLQSSKFKSLQNRLVSFRLELMKLSAAELSKRLGISRATIFNLKKLYPIEYPQSFDKVEAWRNFAWRTRLRRK